MNFALQFIGFIWTVLTVPLAALLLFVAATWDGRAFALAALCAGLAPLLGALGWALERRRWLRTAAALGVIFVVLTLILLVRAPRGVAAAATTRAQHHYAKEGRHFSRFALGNILPECDQLMLGFTLMTALDPLLTVRQAHDLKSMTRDIYRELEHDPDFHALGSSMPEVYDELIGRGIHTDHTYLYLPPGLDRTRPCRALVFLHGSGGNFKAYLWILSRLADRKNLVLIAPSYGMGNWAQPDTNLVVESALKSAATRVQLDPNALHLMGLSNGGLGVTQLVASHRPSFHSVIFLSPVFDRGELTSATFSPRIEGKPILILTGVDDDRIPLDYVESCAADLKRAGARVTLEAVPGANHFLIFSEQAKLLTRLEEWFSLP